VVPKFTPLVEVVVSVVVVVVGLVKNHREENR
jgi:hypothetical protein